MASYTMGNNQGGMSSSSASCASSDYEGSISPVRSPDTTTDVHAQITPGKPFLKILEEPQDKFRFRYKTEMHGAHGTILGVRSNNTIKTFPAVQLYNYRANIGGPQPIIRCTLYSTDAEENRRVAHVHRMVSKDHGLIIDDPIDIVVDGSAAVFKNMTILFTKKEEQEKVLFEKKVKHFQKMYTKPKHVSWDTKQLKVSVAEELRRIDFNGACLRFDALIDNGRGEYEYLCKPVYSRRINNLKNPQTNDLKICRIDKCAGTCLGDDEVFMFVEKVVKKNIKIKFFEENSSGEIIWADYAKFGQDDVHHQFAIAFKTPRYRNLDISESVEVQFQLERPSDKAVSSPLKFTFTPDPHRRREMYRKRPRLDSTLLLPTVLGIQPATDSEVSVMKDIDPLPCLDELELDIREILNDVTNTSEDCLKTNLEYSINNKISSSEWSANSILKLLSAEEREAVMQLRNSGRLMEYGLLNGESEGANLLMDHEYQEQMISDYQFDGPSPIPDNENTSNKHDENSVSKLCDKFQTSKLNDNSCQMKIPPTNQKTNIIFYKNSIVAKTEKVLNVLGKLKQQRRLNGKLYQAWVIKLFSYTVKDTDDSVIHVLASCTEKTNLVMAAKFIKILKIFNEVESIINTKNANQETPLLVAAKKGTPEMVSLLLEAGANVTAKDLNNDMAVHLAVVRKTDSLEVLAALMVKQPNLDVYNNDGYTPLHLAVLKRKSDIVSSILVKTEDKWCKDDIINMGDLKRGNTPLHIAVENRFKEIVNLLLNFEDKIDINIKNHDGKTPLSFVVSDKDNVSREIAEKILSLQKQKIDVVGKFKEETPDSLIDLVNSDDEQFSSVEVDIKVPKSEVKPKLEPPEPELIIADDNMDECESAYAREWDDHYLLFDKATISKLCPILDEKDRWKTLLKRLKYTPSETDYCKIHWSPSLSSFKLAELNHPEVTARKIRDELINVNLIKCARLIDDMLHNHCQDEKMD